MRTVIVNSNSQKTYAINLINQMPVDGSETVITKKTDDSSTAKQRRLQWLWYTEVAASGLGSDDNKDGVHVRSKWKFARPILLRDDELFGLIYHKFMETIEGSAAFSDFCKMFCEQYISTERMARRQRAEYLTEFQRFWLFQGVELTNPEMQGLDERLGWKEKINA